MSHHQPYPPYGMYGPGVPSWWAPPNIPTTEPINISRKEAKRWKKFWDSINEEAKKKEKKPSLKDRFDAFFVLCVAFPIVAPLYVLLVKQLITLAAK